MAQAYTNFGGTGDRTKLITMTSDFSSDASYTNGRTLNASVNASNSDGWFITSGISVGGGSVRFDFLCAPRIIDKVKIYVGAGGMGTAVFQWQGGNGDGTWTNLGSTFSLSGTSPFEIDLANSTAYQTYRMLGVSGTSGNGNIDFEFSIDDAVTAGYLNAKVGATATVGGTSLACSAITTTADAWLVLVLFGEHPSNVFSISSITDTAGLTWTKRSQFQSVSTNAKLDVEYWYARMPTPGSNTVTLHFDLAADDVIYNLLAFSNLPDMSSPWKSGVTGGTYHNDTATLLVPNPAISFTGRGIALINGGSSKNNIPDKDLGYAEGQAIGAFTNSGGSQWSYGNMSAAVLHAPSSRTIVYRGQVHDFAALVDVIDLGGGTGGGGGPIEATATVAALALEIASTGPASTAQVAASDLEILSSGPASNVQVSAFALEVLVSAASAPVRAVDGSKIYEFSFAFQPSTIYNEADWDSIYSVGDRFGNGLLETETIGFAGETGSPSNLINDDWSDDFSVDGQTGYPSGAYHSFWTVSGEKIWISGLQWFADVSATLPADWAFYGGVNKTSLALNTQEFADFQIDITTNDVTLGLYTKKLEFTPTFAQYNWWAVQMVGAHSGDPADFAGASFGPELMLKTLHSILDGGDRRSTNGRASKRVTIATSSGIVLEGGGADNLIDGQYNHDNRTPNKTTETFISRAGGSVGDKTISAAGQYIQFSFPRSVLMREMVLNASDAEVFDSGGDPTLYGRWQWQASNAPASGFVNMGDPWTFNDTGSRWLVAPRWLDETANSPNSFLFPYWRMVLVDGPAFGDLVGVYQIQFNLLDPDNASPILEAAFTDDVDGVLPLVTIGPAGNPYVLAFTDGDSDVMTTTADILPNLNLTIAFSDGDSDVMNTRGSFYPPIFSQTMVIVRGK